MDDAYFNQLSKFIEECNKHACMKNPEEDAEWFCTWELDMAKAFLSDSPDGSIRVAKIILALKDIGDIRIKIE